MSYGNDLDEDPYIMESSVCIGDKDALAASASTAAGSASELTSLPDRRPATSCSLSLSASGAYSSVSHDSLPTYPRIRSVMDVLNDSDEESIFCDPFCDPEDHTSECRLLETWGILAEGEAIRIGTGGQSGTDDARVAGPGEGQQRKPQPLVQPKGDIAGENQKFICVFQIGLEDDEEFCLVKRILGKAGNNMRRIAEECSAKVRLRGIGSGFLEGADGKEANMPLQLNVSCTDFESYSVAADRVATLLKDLYKHYRRYTRSKGLEPPDVKISLEEVRRDDLSLDLLTQKAQRSPSQRERDRKARERERAVEREKQRERDRERLCREFGTTADDRVAASDLVASAQAALAAAAAAETAPAPPPAETADPPEKLSEPDEEPKGEEDGEREDGRAEREEKDAPVAKAKAPATGGPPYLLPGGVPVPNTPAGRRAAARAGGAAAAAVASAVAREVEREERDKQREQREREREEWRRQGCGKGGKGVEKGKGPSYTPVGSGSVPYPPPQSMVDKGKAGFQPRAFQHVQGVAVGAPMHAKGKGKGKGDYGKGDYGKSDYGKGDDGKGYYGHGSAAASSEYQLGPPPPPPGPPPHNDDHMYDWGSEWSQWHPDVGQQRSDRPVRWEAWEGDWTGNRALNREVDWEERHWGDWGTGADWSAGGRSSTRDADWEDPSSASAWWENPAVAAAAAWWAVPEGKGRGVVRRARGGVGRRSKGSGYSTAGGYRYEGW